MKHTSKARQSLRVVLLGALTLVVIVGGYLVYCYPSVLPPFYHKDKVQNQNTLVAALSNDTSRSLPVQSTRADYSISINSAPAKPPTSSLTPSAAVNLPTVSNAAVSAALPEKQPQIVLNVASGPQPSAGRAHTATKGLIGSLADL